MNAADVMTRAVVTVQSDATIVDAIRLMLGQRISGLPVVDDADAVIGMLTEGDLLRRSETGTERRRARWLDFLRGPGRQAEDYVQAHGRKVGEVMTRNVLSVSEGTPIDEVVELMESRRVKRVAVVTGNRLVGIVSRADLLRTLLQALEQDVETAPADATLRKQVVAELSRQPWGRHGQVTVIVTDGVVYLEGTIYDVRERDAMKVAAENVAGVKEVRDHLNYFDTNVGLLTYGL